MPAAVLEVPVELNVMAPARLMTANCVCDPCRVLALVIAITNFHKQLIFHQFR